MRRRELLAAGAGATLLASAPYLRRWYTEKNLPITVSSPGMAEGHWLRDHPVLPAARGERRVDTVIIGSGIAGLTAAWKLQREGYHDFALLNGPETCGNAAGGQTGELRYPLGAHYLPVPTLECTHVREILADFGILQGPAGAERPAYDESLLLHAPQERLLLNGRWQDGYVPFQGVDKAEIAQQARFFAYTESLKNRRGRDGRKLFALPVVLSSSDEEWRALDRQTFAAWLDAQGYTAPTLRWYLDYCCRDDYGALTTQVSAWAGLHYFASRTGQASNAGADAVLTWPDGLHPLAARLAATSKAQALDGFAVNVQPDGAGWQVLYLTGVGGEAIRLRARHVIIATPLHVAARLLPLQARGFDPDHHMPPHAPWMVSNFIMKSWPEERGAEDTPLSWDNVVYGGRAMGYVVSTHQLIRVARPPRTVFSAYQAFSYAPPADIRRWLIRAGRDELLAESATDLLAAYGGDFWEHVDSLAITLRGHAMASPSPGFLSNPGLAALRASDQGLYFAHSDLSGFSVFEEASWWGWQAASRILAA